MGICVTGYTLTHTHTSSQWELEPAVSLVKRDPGVWPLLLPSPLLNFSPILLTSLSLFHTQTLDPALSIFPAPFSTPTQSVFCADLPSPFCHYLSHALQVSSILTCRLFCTNTPRVIFSCLAAPTQMSQNLLQCNQNLIMQRASPSES